MPSGRIFWANWPRLVRVFDLHPGLERPVRNYCQENGLNPIFFCRKSIATIEYYKNKPQQDTCAVMMGVLHQLPVDEGLALVETAGAFFAELVLVDYRVPERNLDFPAVWLGAFQERLGSHCSAYTAFMRNGGIEGIPTALRSVPKDRRGLWYGGVGLVRMGGGK